MDFILGLLGPLSVGTRIILAAGAAVLFFAILVALTAIFTRFTTALVLWLGVALAAVAALYFMPIGTATFAADPRPTADYAGALARFQADREALTEELNPLCEPQLLTRGERTARVVVLIHGVSSCPRTFVELAELIHAQGANVLSVLMPQNGFADSSTDALRNLTAEDLRKMGDDAVDIAAGLGDEVVVLGISAGGTVAAWAAQNRAEVDRAVLVAPFFGLSSFGRGVNRLLRNAMLLLPHISMWRNPTLREEWDTLPHAYARHSTRATAEIMRLGAAVYEQAGAGPPAAGEIAVAINDADTAVSAAMADDFVERWAQMGAAVTLYTFDESENLPHELIEPLEPGANTAIVYPVLQALVDDPASIGTPASP